MQPISKVVLSNIMHVFSLIKFLGTSGVFVLRWSQFQISTDIYIQCMYTHRKKTYREVEEVEKREFGETGLCTVCFVRTEDKV